MQYKDFKALYAKFTLEAEVLLSLNAKNIMLYYGYAEESK